MIILFTQVVNFGNAQTRNLILHFENKAGDETIQADSIYQNAFGETFSVHNFKYYISNITLNDAEKNQSFPNKYFLIDNEDSSSQQIELNTSLKSITGIKFLLGVDSLKNVSGVQSGALDPARGMFWTWNTGYVMAKFEGNSSFANMPQHAFSYHVGGYKQNENAAREIILQIPQTIDCTKGCSVTINADVLKWFNGVNEIKIANNPFCHQPGTLAIRLADNYAAMFSVQASK